MSSVSLDTGAIVEYVDLAGAFHAQASAVFEGILAGKLLGVVPHPTLAETYYVAYRIYERLGLEQPEGRAEKLVEWFFSSPNFEIAEPSLELALLAGRIKREFGLALTDAYVIAASKLHKGKALFRTREKEIEENITQIAKNYDLVFLEDYGQEPPPEK